jgi:hypothetical protein
MDYADRGALYAVLNRPHAKHRFTVRVAGNSAFILSVRE